MSTMSGRSYLASLGCFAHHVQERRTDERVADVLPRPHPPDGEQEGEVTQHPRYKNQRLQLQVTHNGKEP